MNLLKTFLLILSLGTLASIGVITLFSSSYSIVPRSLEGATQEVFGLDLQDGDDIDLVQRDLYNDKPRFSLRELAHNVDHEQTLTKPISGISPKNNENTKTTNINIEGKGVDTKPNLGMSPKGNEDDKTKDINRENEFTDKLHDHTKLKNNEDIKSINISVKDDLVNDPQLRSKNDTETRVIQHKVNKELNDPVPKATALTNNETAIQIVQQQHHCEPHINIVLLKTHKTGSSTMQNILYRFGDARGLSFVLPSVDVYMGNPAYFSPRFAIPSADGYNILANHARYHKGNMAKIMPADTVYVSILRFPPKQFESMYSYYGFNNKFHTSLEGFANRANFYYSKFEGSNPRHSGLNPVLYDLGLNKKDLASPDKIDKWIEYIDESFDLILIAEYLYESLILLKELMCWTWDDITFFSSNKRNGSLVQKLPSSTVHQLLEWHKGDYKLYLHFNRTLHDKIKKYGVTRMKNDVDFLMRKNEGLKDDCLQGTKPVKEMGGKTVIDRYVLKPSAKTNLTCARMTYAAYDYLTMLRHKQKLKKPGAVKRHLL